MEQTLQETQSESNVADSTKSESESGKKKFVSSSNDTGSNTPFREKTMMSDDSDDGNVNNYQEREDKHEKNLDFVSPLATTPFSHTDVSINQSSHEDSINASMMTYAGASNKVVNEKLNFSPEASVHQLISKGENEKSLTVTKDEVDEDMEYNNHERVTLDEPKCLTPKRILQQMESSPYRTHSNESESVQDILEGSSKINGLDQLPKSPSHYSIVKSGSYTDQGSTVQSSVVGIHFLESETGASISTSPLMRSKKKFNSNRKEQESVKNNNVINENKYASNNDNTVDYEKVKAMTKENLDQFKMSNQDGSIIDDSMEKSHHKYNEINSFAKSIPNNSDDDADEVNSLVSQYGSDSGVYQSRLQDVENLQPLMEEEEEEQDQEQDQKQKQKQKESIYDECQNDMNSDIGEDWKSSVAMGGSEASEYIHRRRSQLLAKCKKENKSFSKTKNRKSPMSPLERKIKSKTLNLDDKGRMKDFILKFDNKKNDYQSNPARSSAVVDNNNSMIKSGSTNSIKSFENHQSNNLLHFSPKSPKTEKTIKIDKSPPSTPIQAMSTAIRRIGSGVTSITRNSKNYILETRAGDEYSQNKDSSPNFSPVSPIQNDAEKKAKYNADLRNGKNKSQTISLSSSFRRARECVSFDSERAHSPLAKQVKIQQQFIFSESPKRAPIRGIVPKSDVDNLDSLKQRLIATEEMLAEKNKEAKRLDQELSMCRAEIGRLKSVSKSEILLVSQNRSILDDNDDDDSSSASSFGKNDLVDASALADVSAINVAPESSIREGDDEFDLNLSMNEALSTVVDTKREVVLLKAALEKANMRLKEVEIWNNSPQKENELSKLSVLNKNSKSSPCEPESGTTISNSIEARNDEEEDEKEQIEKTTNDNEDLTLLHPSLAKELEKYVDAVQKNDRLEIKLLQEKVKELEEKIKESSESYQIDESTDKGDKRMVHVHMLNGENFVTEWDELAPPLPPPPDHGLRSPIVFDLLSQWTSDQNLQNELMVWMEDVLEGVSPSSIPPLEISNLDHQARDGFTMHILPLLLRRPDIHVKVTTRVHRLTSYDLSVNISNSNTNENTVTPTPKRSIGNMFKSNNIEGPNTTANLPQDSMHMMAYSASCGTTGLTSPPSNPIVHENERGSESGGSVTHSSITTPISNFTPNFSDNKKYEKNRDNFVFTPDPSSHDEISVGSSITGASSMKSSQQSIMGAIGGAFGGLLSRRKPTMTLQHSSTRPTISFDDDIWHESQQQSISDKVKTSGHISSSDTNENQSKLRVSKSYSPAHSNMPDRMNDNELKEQPYHRVVSAPPGRIGITFVQYRGNCLVSDVSSQSPLSGWVFPSDILIAIDELPVSGLRVREIVKILTARKSSQRALRMISSHAMTELTQHTSAVMNG